MLERLRFPGRPGSGRQAGGRAGARGRVSGGGEQAGRTAPVAPGGGLGIVSVVAGLDPPAGTGQQLGRLAGVERGPGRLAPGGDRGLEPGPGFAAGAGGRDADGQAAARPRDLPELDQDALQHGGLQIDRHAFEQEQAGPAGIQPGGGQPVSDRVAGEVGRHELHLAGGQVAAGPAVLACPAGSRDGQPRTSGRRAWRNGRHGRRSRPRRGRPDGRPGRWPRPPPGRKTWCGPQGSHASARPGSVRPPRRPRPGPHRRRHPRRKPGPG